MFVMHMEFACFRPEKKAKWKTCNECSLFICGGSCVLPRRSQQLLLFFFKI